MARKGRRKPSGDLAVLLIAGVIAYFVVEPRYGLFVFILLAASVVLLWISFFMPTLCGYDLGPRGCIREVYGKLNGCRQHAALKRDAIFAAMRMRNPGQLIRVKWSDGSSPKGRTVGATSSPPPPVPQSKPEKTNARRGKYDMAMLIFTVVGSLGTVLTLLLQK